jgi:hypothetical protein
MVMRKHALQFPPLKKEGLEINQKILRLVGEQYDAFPLPDSPGGDSSTFSPIRGGHLSIRHLRVVDAFGQVMKVVDQGEGSPIYVSRSLSAPGEKNSIHLPPRLAQPGRLLFRWNSAEDDRQESNSDPRTHPICGWILPNRLDNSLVIYDAHGRELGALQWIDDPQAWGKKGIRWSPLPLAPPEPDASTGASSRPTSKEISNPHLLNFIRGLLNLGDRTREDNSFSDFLHLIGEMDQYIHPSGEWQRQNLSILIGRPLALVRASLRLQLDGPPATDQSWIQSGRFNPQGFTKIEFPVRLGDLRKGQDGLVGYFVEDHFETIRLSSGAPDQPGVKNMYFEYNADLPLTLDPEAKPLRVTLLMDPQVGIHITSGILPTKFVELPPHGISDALSAMDITFLSAPLMGGRSEVPGLPLPGDIQGEWLWISTAEDGRLNEPKPVEKDRSKTPSLFSPMKIHEGWLTLRRALKKSSGTDH